MCQQNRNMSQAKTSEKRAMGGKEEGRRHHAYRQDDNLEP